MEELFPEGITETIVTTLSSAGIPNAAPMGIVKRGDSLFIRMFPGTRTYQNVKETGYLVANIVTDPMIFVVSAFEDLDINFYDLQQGDMPPIVKGAWAWAYFKADIEGTVRLRPLSSKIVRTTVPCFSRGFAAVIDATITGTRLHLLGEAGKARIRENEVLVSKCGTARDLEAMRKLKEILSL